MTESSKGGFGAFASMSDMAYAKLKAAIISNVMAPGARINEMAVGEELGMSRTPIREALYRLEREGLVEASGKRGVQVSLLRPEALEEVYEVLAALEVQAAGLLAAVSPRERRLFTAEMQSALHAMETALAQNDVAAWSHADGRFHAAILEGSGNARLARIAATEFDIGRRTRLYTLHRRSDLASSMQEHCAILEAVKTGDVQAARAAMLDHRTRAAREIVRLLRQPV